MPNIIPSVSTDDTNPSSAHEDAVKSLINGGFGERQAREIIASVRGEAQEVGHRAGLRRAIEAVRGEYLTDATGESDDESYNQGVSDAVAAIGALLEGGAA